MFGDVKLNVPEYYALAGVYFIGRESLGRRKLAERIGLTESKTRTMLEHLEDSGYVAVDDATGLTGQGERVFSQLRNVIESITEVELGDLSVSEQNYAALLDGGRAEIGSELELRDAAVRAGAEGMLILEYDGGFRFPSGERVEGGDGLSELEASLNPVDGDLLLVSSAESLEGAKAGLWSAVEHLMD